jgi:hypothetical protein
MASARAMTCVGVSPGSGGRRNPCAGTLGATVIAAQLLCLGMYDWLGSAAQGCGNRVPQHPTKRCHQVGHRARVEEVAV